jgi:predicted RNA-binding Zn-ribbon protein involved in translation (DUF1610 family)
MITKPFKCQNCGLKMELYKLNVKHCNELYDKWTCDACPIIVLDWRAEK